MRPITDITDIARDPCWLAHRYDPGHDAVHVVHLSRDDHRRANFLTDAELPAGAPRLVLRRDELLAAAPDEAPLHFIFHSAFCCSTLLARGLDLPGSSMSLKEPVFLNEISGWRRQGADPQSLGTVLNSALHLLGRAWSPGEAVVVKPSNVTNGLCSAMLTLRPNARAVLLHTSLDRYLGSIARKGLWGRLWVRELFIALAKDQLLEFGFSSEEYLGQSDLQIAALGWLAQQKLFAQLVQQFGARVRSLDSEVLVTRPQETIEAATRLFKLRVKPEMARAIADGPVFSRHSKADRAFGADQRALEGSSGLLAHADEIEKVAEWARAVAKAANIETAPQTTLLS